MFGLWKRKASLRPCLTKSTVVPLMSGRLSGIDEYLDAAVLEYQVARGRVVGVVDDVGKPRAAGLAHAEPQAQSLAAGGEEVFDAFSSSLCQRNGHVCQYLARDSSAARNASSTISSRPSFSVGTANFSAQSGGTPGESRSSVCAFEHLT